MASSAASTAATGGGAAMAEDIKKLQGQVDQLRERLDFISPMLPLVNFVQDYFQKVECEASVQLMRLKNAQVLRPRRPGEDEEIANAQLETVKYFHFLTDAITEIHSASGAGASGGGGAAGAAGAGLGSSPRGPASSSPLHAARPAPLTSSAIGSSAAASATAALGGFPTSPSRTASSWGASATPGPGAGAAGGPGMASPSARTNLGPQPQSLSFANASPSASALAAGTPSPAPGAGGGEPPFAALRGEIRDGGSFLIGAGGYSGGLSTSRGSPSATGPSATASSSPSLSPGSVVRLPPKGSAPHGAEPCFLVEPLAEPGTGGTNGLGGGAGSSSSGAWGGGGGGCSDLDGLILGRGSWASAFRQASGPRREALRLLCRSSIVTARELSDDLTVISQEHIDECVQIAQEMLQTWTLDMWAQQPEEAKKFFEARLTALYQRKFGEQKG